MFKKLCEWLKNKYLTRKKLYEIRREWLDVKSVNIHPYSFPKGLKILFSVPGGNANNILILSRMSIEANSVDDYTEINNSLLNYFLKRSIVSYRSYFLNEDEEGRGVLLDGIKLWNEIQDNLYKIKIKLHHLDSGFDKDKYYYTTALKQVINVIELFNASVLAIENKTICKKYYITEE